MLRGRSPTIGALIIRIGFWGYIILYLFRPRYYDLNPKPSDAVPPVIGPLRACGCENEKLAQERASPPYSVGALIVRIGLLSSGVF